MIFQMQVDKNCNATVTAPNNQIAARTGNVNPSNGNQPLLLSELSDFSELILFFFFHPFQFSI